MEPVFDALGDRALLVTLSREVSAEANDEAVRLARAVERATLPGVDEAQPAYSSFCVHFDPSRVRASYIEAVIRGIMEARPDAAAAAAAAASAGSRTVEIPVVYGGDEGPDLEWSAQYLGLSTGELVRRHTAGNYRVFMIGFTPGFAYLGGMDESIALPRLPEPRPRVAAGSVGIGGSQTGVYPWETPGGWRILGRTGLSLFSPSRNDPSLLHPGDTVRFVSVDRQSMLASGSGAEAGGAPSGQAAQQAAQIAARSFAQENRGIPSLLVEHPGFFTVVVDEGRFGYRKIGVPVSGAADSRSYRLGNEICDNAPGEAALEMTLLGGRFRALSDLTLAVTGANAPVRIDGAEAGMNSALFLPKGSCVEIGSLLTGCRTYLAVAGGLDVPPVLRSRSTYVRGKFGGYQGRALKPGDVLRTGPAPDHAFIVRQRTDNAGGRPCDPVPAPDGSDTVAILQVVPGPEAEPSLLDALCSEPYSVNAESDRMGLRLTGPKIQVGRSDILSSPVVPGTVQVPSDGKPLLILCDGQTTGGYKRVAVAVSDDLPLAGQLRPGSRVRFRFNRTPG